MLTSVYKNRMIVNFEMLQIMVIKWLNDVYKQLNFYKYSRCRPLFWIQ